MAPSVFHLFAGAGTSLAGFKDAGFCIAGGVDSDMVALTMLNKTYKSARVIYLPLLAEIEENEHSIRVVQARLGHRKRPTVLLYTPPPSLLVDKTWTNAIRWLSMWLSELQPIACVLVLPKKVQGLFDFSVKDILTRTGYDAMFVNSCAAEFGVPTKKKYTVALMVRKQNIGHSGTAVEAMEAFTKFVVSLRGFGTTCPVSPRTVLMRSRPLYWKKREYVYLYPRCGRNSCENTTHSIHFPLPPLRASCTCDGARSAHSGVLNVNDVLALYGLDKHYDINIFSENLPKIAGIKLFIRSLPLSLSFAIAMSLKPLAVHDDCDFERPVVFLSHVEVMVFVNEQIKQSAETDGSATLAGLTEGSRMKRMMDLGVPAQHYWGRNGAKRRRIRYVLGSNDKIDQEVDKIAKIYPGRGWVMELRERSCSIHAKDDLFWQSPKGVVVRSRRKLLDQLSLEANETKS